MQDNYDNKKDSNMKTGILGKKSKETLRQHES